MLKQISRPGFASTVFCSLIVAQLSVAQEADLSPQQQVEQATQAFFRSVNQRDAEPTNTSVGAARDYFSGYPRDNPGGKIRNVRVLKTTIESESKARIEGRLWVVPCNGKAGKTFTFEHSLEKKDNVWNTETLLYNYISKDEK